VIEEIFSVNMEKQSLKTLKHKEWPMTSKLFTNERKSFCLTYNSNVVSI
jgi:hypothetical protein